MLRMELELALQSYTYIGTYHVHASYLIPTLHTYISVSKGKHLKTRRGGNISK